MCLVEDVISDMLQTLHNIIVPAKQNKRNMNQIQLTGNSWTKGTTEMTYSRSNQSNTKCHSLGVYCDFQKNTADKITTDKQKRKRKKNKQTLFLA